MPAEQDYIDRTIATVRNHRDADNCWPSWANTFADEIERLRAELLAAQEREKAHGEGRLYWRKRAEAAEEREKALREALGTVEPLIDAQFEGHADMGEYMAKVQKLNEALDVVRAALAGSPSEKPVSEEPPHEIDWASRLHLPGREA
ncbi:MAG TPA: hypothetical protein VNH80_04940 [Burkholderiales bacterium]|nr:hypothetical protein [Burkholderiales bacterium]